MRSVDFQKQFNVILSPLQRQAFDCKARQKNYCGLEGTGKSFEVYCEVINKTVSKDNTTVFFCSPSDRQSREKENKIDSIIYQADKSDLISHSVARYREFINGSKVFFISASAKPENVKGFHSQFNKSKTNPICVVLDDTTAISEAFAQAVIASLFTASEWSLILAFNPTDTSCWVYQHYDEGLKRNPDIKTFEFTANDNPLLNKSVLKHFGSISEDYIRRFSGNWDASLSHAFPPDILNPCVDDSFSLSLPAENSFSYSLGVDLNDVLGESIGRDRDRAVFLVLGKCVEETKTTYKVVAYDSFQRSTIAEWVECVKRLNNMYRLERFYIESPHASGLIEALKKEQLGDRLQLCNPHRTNDVFSLKTAYDYLNTVIHNRMLKIPHDAKALLKELKELKVEMTASREIRFHHKRHGHNDFVVALSWVLLGMRDLERTGGVDYGDVLRLNSRGRKRLSARNDPYLNPIGAVDREFLSLPSRRDMNDGYI